jgi:hypothetical protein
MTMLRIALALALLVASAVPSFATSEVFTVTTCGTLPAPYTAGRPNAITVDINGNTCTTSVAGGLPAGATQVTGNGSGTTGAVVATLPGVAAKTTWICSFNVSAAGTGAIGPITIAGLAGGSQTYQLTAPGWWNLHPVPSRECRQYRDTVTTTADTATAVNVNANGW